LVADSSAGLAAGARLTLGWMWRPQQAHIGDLERLTSMGGVKPTPEIGLLTSKKMDPL